MTTPAQLVARRDRLFDYLADHGSGATAEEVQADLQLSRKQFDNTLRSLRRWCGEYDEINVVCDPQGQSQPWLYRLVGNLDAARAWQANQIKHLETRLESSLAIANSLVAANPDGRRIEAKKAKRIAKVLGRLIEDLDEIREDA